MTLSALASPSRKQAARVLRPAMVRKVLPGWSHVKQQPHRSIGHCNISTMCVCFVVVLLSLSQQVLVSTRVRSVSPTHEAASWHVRHDRTRHRHKHNKAHDPTRMQSHISATVLSHDEGRSSSLHHAALNTRNEAFSQLDRHTVDTTVHSRIVRWTDHSTATTVRTDSLSGMRYPLLTLAPPPLLESTPLDPHVPEEPQPVLNEPPVETVTTHIPSTHQDDQRRWQEECVPMVSWQSRSFPVCNVLHELSVPDFVVTDASDNHEIPRTAETLSLLSTQGSWRTVWKLQRHTPLAPPETVVVKLLKLHRDFDTESFEQHRVDALAMERLTGRRTIVDIYAFCGQSVLSEFAAGNARTFVKNETLSPLQRLVVGRDMAQALADLHSIDYPNATNITLTHNDLNMANLVAVDGRIKLNDFNIGILQRWNRTSQTICRSPVRFAAPLWKSPEEIRNISAVSAAPTDVFGLGNLLFQVLTRRQPWTHLEPHGALTAAEAAQRKCAGEMPFVPYKYRGELDGTVTALTVVNAALYRAVQSCFRPEPERRPTAHEIAQQLDHTVQYVQAQVVQWKQERKRHKTVHLEKRTKVH